MKGKTLRVLFMMFCCCRLSAQDTFSILAYDSITGEVGAAGASCVDLFAAPGLSNDFIVELIPGEGAIATQAQYLFGNQSNARNQFLQGDSPSQIIAWLLTNDVQNTPAVRQYGVIRNVNGKVETAAHTGTACLDYKNHITGPNYTIHGNILLGRKVLDSMEARFNREKGDLACKLMSALQGAKMTGADSRCTPDNSSSLFAFIKVTLPADTFGKPSFLLSLKTHSMAGIEPIDSVQRMFSRQRSCLVNTTGILDRERNDDFEIFPNPADQVIFVRSPFGGTCFVRDVLGKVRSKSEIQADHRLDIHDLEKGVYFIEFSSDRGSKIRKVVILR